MASAVTHQSKGLQHIRQTWRIGMHWNALEPRFQMLPEGLSLPSRQHQSVRLSGENCLYLSASVHQNGFQNWKPASSTVDLSPHLSPWGGPKYFAGFQSDLIRPQLGSSPHDFARPRLPRILSSSGSIRMNSAGFSSSPRKFISKNAERQPIPRSISEATLWARLEQVL